MVWSGAQWKIHPSGGVKIYFDTSRRESICLVYGARSPGLAVNNDCGDVISRPHLAPPASAQCERAGAAERAREKTPPDITRTIFAHNTAILDLAQYRTPATTFFVSSNAKLLSPSSWQPNQPPPLHPRAHRECKYIWMRCEFAWAVLDGGVPCKHTRECKCCVAGSRRPLSARPCEF